MPPTTATLLPLLSLIGLRFEISRLWFCLFIPDRPLHLFGRDATVFVRAVVCAVSSFAVGVGRTDAGAAPRTTRTEKITIIIYHRRQVLDAAFPSPVRLPLPPRSSLRYSPIRLGLRNY